jgi:glycosyltransferase involved in cell wall biosynthesis
MRIILATPVYPPEVGGPATYTVELAERLRGQHEVVIVAYADNAQAVPSTNLIAISKQLSLLTRLWRYYRVLKREAKKADLIYVQNAVASGLPAVWAGKKRKKPVILKFVGDEAWERATQAGQTTKQLEEFYQSPQGGLYTKILLAVERYVLNNVSLVTTPSQYLADLLNRFYEVPQEGIVVNYNAVDVLPVPSTTPRRPHQLMTAVRLVVWKNVAGIIKAVGMLKDKFSDIRFIVAGEGPEKEPLKALVQSMGLGEHVLFSGGVSKERIRELQEESEVQVLNSSYEGMPHGVLESFATKCPIIATNIPGTREAIEDGKNGLLVRVGDDKALAEAIERLFLDPALREQLAQAGFQTLQEKFSWDAHVQRLEAMFAIVKQ